MNVGDVVTWRNNGSVPHTVTATNGSFDSGSLAAGNSFQTTFTTAGTFAYSCQIHGATVMSGSVTVLAGPSTTAPPGSASAPSPVPGQAQFTG